MDSTTSPMSESGVTNGFVNSVFSVSLDEENKEGSSWIPESISSQSMFSCQPVRREKQELNRRSRTAAIWRILNRRKTTSDMDRRPHSMILQGEASFLKLSITNKVRSFKKFKSPSVFRGKAGKLSSFKFNSELKDDMDGIHMCNDSPFLEHKNMFRNKAKRHSIAGPTTDFFCAFDDTDPCGIPEKTHDVLRDISHQNGCKLAERVTYTKKGHPSFSNCNNSSVTDHEECYIKQSPKIPHRRRWSKGGEVLNYLRKIPFKGRESSTLAESSFESLNTLDKTIDSDYGSVNFEFVKDLNSTPKQTGLDGKSSHFRSLFRFFNSVAETAMKWRNSSHSFSPPQGQRSPFDSRKPQLPGEAMQNMPLTNRIEHKADTSCQSALLADSHKVVSTANDFVVCPPLVVLKTRRTYPVFLTDSSSLCDDSDGSQSQLNSISLATIENHPRSEEQEPINKKNYSIKNSSIPRQMNHLCGKTMVEDQDSCTHTKKIPKCPEDIFKVT